MEQSHVGSKFQKKTKSPDTGGKNNKMKNKQSKQEKVKLYRDRVKSTQIEAKEISNLQVRYQALDVSQIKTFSDIPLSKKTLKGLKDSEYNVPTEIQRESIGLALKGFDILGAAKTGSGKTLAFLIPVIEALFCKQWTRMDGLGALIITPTRELAYQIFETLRKVGRYHEFSAGLIIGGKDLNFEKKRLQQCNIMICTPGRLLHHMDENPLLDASNLQLLVIDEADRCLDLGFQATMNGIIENLPPKRQTLLFSATQTKSVKDLARLSLKDPMYVSVHEHAKHSTPESLRQSYIVTEAHNKTDVLWSFIKSHKRKKIIVFMTSCKQVRFMYQAFCRLRPGVSVLALHGAMHQLKRMAVYEEFCGKENAVLFATDIAARGLDFPSVHWVLQLDCPDDANSYIHRAGRTARFEMGGESLLVLLPSEEAAMVEHLKEKKIPIQKIDVNPRKLVSIQRKLEAILARDVELKQMAQRAFVTYLKAVFLMKDKQVFDVTKIDLDSFARSLGLAVSPRVRFLQRREKERAKSSKAKKVPAQEDAEDLSEEEVDEEAEDVEAKPEASWRREDLKDTYRFDVGEESEDDLLVIKRVNHKIEGEVEEDEEEAGELETRKKKNKILTKEALAKRIIRKKITANQKVNFDEEGNRVFDAAKEKVSEAARKYELGLENEDEDEVGGIDIERARNALREEDKFDKELFRQKIKKRHREERLKAKMERRQAQMDKEKKKDEEEEGEEGNVDDWGDEEDYSDTGSVADLIDALPDPDKIYGPKGSSDSAESDSDSEYSETEQRKPVPSRKRQIVVNDSDDDEDEDARRKVTKKGKAMKKKAKKDDEDFDTGLGIRDDEELALHLLKGGF